MRMPGMNGAELLAKASLTFPHTTRILLTGYAEADAAIAAVNHGHVFRFLLKPCPPPELVAAVEAGVELHRQTVAEQTLLEQTLHGSIKILTEVMSITNPVSFGRAQRIKQHVSALCDKLELSERWQVEVAAMLSQLATFTLPPETLEKVYYGATLSPEEQAMLDRSPDVTEQLLSHVPRLELVREILATYTKSYRKPDKDQTHEQAKLQRLSQILRVAVDFDTLEAQGQSSGVALTTLNGRADQYEPQVLAALLSLFGQRREGDKIRDISVAALRSGMVLAADVKMATGTLFVARGYEVTPAFLERIRNFRPGSVREPIKVLIRAA
jgi:response regulator RpfG family c-di-GMP phosphodiesterase